MTLGFLFQALMGAFLKAATVSASAAWALLVAYVFAGVVQFLSLSHEGFQFIKTTRIGSHLGRAVFGMLSTLLFVLVLPEISLLNATLLLNTAPLFVPILAIFLLNTKAGWKTWISLCVGFLGVALILKPNISSFYNDANWIGLASGLIQALAFIFVKKLTATEPIRRINLYFFILASCMLAPWVAVFWQTPLWESWLWALCAGAASFLAQLFIVKGYHHADASRVGPFQYASVVFSGVIGWIVWNQVLVLHEIAGTVLVVLGGVFAIVFYQPASSRN